jgi:UDP-glucuronate decarboxylase
LNYDFQQDLNEILNRLKKNNISFRSKTILVTGGAGFLGSWVCDTLVKQGANCVSLDNLSSGRFENISHLMEKDNFRFINHDISKPVFFGLTHHPNGICIGDIKRIDIVMHMASRASPFEFSKYPISILKSNTLGTLSPRSCYDESKRAGEAFVKAYELQHNIKTKIVRIFNTSGPRIRYGPEFGRVIPNFIHQALNDDEITIFGDGSQTRSFIYVVDEIEGILKFVHENKAIGEVINLGSNKEYTILEIAKLIKELTNSKSDIVFKPLPIDDPTRRCADLGKANRILNWQPTTPIKEGLMKTIAWFRDNVKNG